VPTLARFPRALLAEFCRYVILGHSERRAYFGETNEQINRKVRAALAHHLTPVICVGETLEENEVGEPPVLSRGKYERRFWERTSWLILTRL